MRKQLGRTSGIFRIWAYGEAITHDCFSRSNPYTAHHTTWIWSGKLAHYYWIILEYKQSISAWKHICFCYFAPNSLAFALPLPCIPIFTFMYFFSNRVILKANIAPSSLSWNQLLFVVFTTSSIHRRTITGIVETSPSDSHLLLQQNLYRQYANETHSRSCSSQ